MKKPLIITIAVTLILLIAGVWVYLMVFGTPESTDDVFTNLGFQSLNEPVIPNQQPIIDTPTIDRLVDTTSNQLNQLTTRPIAGYTTYLASSTEFVRYVERGTGHVFDINIDTGEETRVSPTTIPYVAEAIFSPNPNIVAMMSHQGYTTATRVGSLDGGQFVSQTLGGSTDNEYFINNTTFGYTTLRGGTTVANELDVTTDTVSEQFSFPFAELTVWWGSDTDPTYLATKPAASLASFIYEINEGTLTPEITNVTGLSGFTNHEQHIITYRTNDGYISATVDVTSGTFQTLPVVALREKCVFDIYNSFYLWCAAPFTVTNQNYLDDWYKGLVINEDYLWLINTTNQTAELVIDPTEASGRSVDMVQVDLNQTADAIYFINKTDRSLWRFDLLSE